MKGAPILFFDQILNLVYPPRCVICKVNLEIKAREIQEFTCNNCKKKLEYIRDDYAVKKAYNKYFDYICSAFFYENIIRKLLLDFKFSNKKYLCDFLSHDLAKVMATFTEQPIDYIVYVPISFRRYMERGYNQSYLIAKRISQELGIPIAKYCLTKVKHNEKQSNLKFKDRLLNTQGVYKVNFSKLIKDKCVLLIDDIYTTGSTVNECSKVLKQAGVKTIIVGTIARAKLL